MRLAWFKKYFLYNMQDTGLKNEIDAVYREMILDLYRNPMNKKKLSEPDFVYREVNTTCGDDIEISIKLQNGMIADIGHQGTGCAISQASVSLLTDFLKGKTMQSATAITKDDMLQLLQIPISHTRLKCALLAWQVLQNIIKKYESKN